MGDVPFPPSRPINSVLFFLLVSLWLMAGSNSLTSTNGTKRLLFRLRFSCCAYYPLSITNISGFCFTVSHVMFRDGEIDCQHLQVGVRGSRYALQGPRYSFRSNQKSVYWWRQNVFVWIFHSYVGIQTSIQSDRCVNMSTFSRFREEVQQVLETMGGGGRGRRLLGRVVLSMERG